MVTRMTVVLICDNCQQESELVATHRVEVDGMGVEAEVCNTCWKRITDEMVKLVENGRKIKAPKRVNGKRRIVA